MVIFHKDISLKRMFDFFHFLFSFSFFSTVNFVCILCLPVYLKSHRRKKHASICTFHFKLFFHSYKYSTFDLRVENPFYCQGCVSFSSFSINFKNLVVIDRKKIFSLVRYYLKLWYVIASISVNSFFFSSYFLQQYSVYCLLCLFVFGISHKQFQNPTKEKN